MLTHRGFSAWIVCQNEPVPEHLVAVEDQHHRVSCWIPSEPGKHFSVHWQDHGGGVHTCGYITLDGYVVPGRFLPGQGTTFRAAVRSGMCLERPFVFQAVTPESPQATSEKAPASSSSENKSKSSARDLGMITLRIRRVKLVSRPHAPNPIKAIPSHVLGKRKAGDVCIGFGQETPAYYQSPMTWSVEPYEGDGTSSYVTFVFRYRSPEFLQSQGIMSEIKATSTSRIPDNPGSIRRIVSAPPIAALQHTNTRLPPPSSHATTHANPPSISLITGASIRNDDPAPSSVKKKKPNQADFMANGPYRLRRPSDMRRAISWRAPNTIPSSQLSQTSSQIPAPSTTSFEQIKFSNPFSSLPNAHVQTHEESLPSLPNSDEGTTDESSGEGGSPPLVFGSSQEGSSQTSGSSPNFGGYHRELQHRHPAPYGCAQRGSLGKS